MAISEISTKSTLEVGYSKLTVMPKQPDPEHKSRAD